MSASLLINQSTGKIYENLYQSPSTRGVATVKNATATVEIPIAHGAPVLLPLESTTFVSNSPDITMAVDNVITINKTGRYRLKATVVAGANSASPIATVPLYQAGPPITATVPASTACAFYFAPHTVPLTVLGNKAHAFVSLNIVQQVSVDSVVSLTVGDEISLYGESEVTTVKLWGKNDPNFVSPAIYVELSEV